MSLLHYLCLWRIQHGMTATRLAHGAVRLAGIAALGVTVYVASDLVVNHLEYEVKAETDLRECVGVLNGSVKMIDRETGEVARVTWSRVNLIGGAK